MTSRGLGPRSRRSPTWTNVVLPPVQWFCVSIRLVCRRMATKSSKALWTSAMATMDSGGSAGAFDGPAHAGIADTRTRRTELQARWEESQTGGRTIFLPPIAEPQNFGENIAFR